MLHLNLTLRWQDVAAFLQSSQAIQNVVFLGVAVLFLATVETRIKRRRALYQIPAIQDLADVVADSLQMARQATALDAPVIVICGVQFMAETAAIANPDKRVLSPDPAAGCSLAATIRPEDVRAWRGAHPAGLVVACVNCSAAVKAEAFEPRLPAPDRSDASTPTLA